MQSNEAPLQVTRSDLQRYGRTALDLLENVDQVVQHRTADRGYAAGSTRDITATKKALDVARTFGPIESKLLADKVNHTLHIVKQGVELGTHIAELYKNASGLEILNNQQTRSGGFSSEAERVEFYKKNQTMAHVTRFVAAYYILWELSTYHTDAVNSVSVPDFDMPRLDYSNRAGSLRSLIYFYVESLERLTEKTPEAFVKLTRVYFEKVLEDIKSVQSTIMFAEPFTERSYQLEGSEFTIHGFTAETRDESAKVEFTRTSFDTIVGNREAKHEARRMVFRVCCYDPIMQRNPFRELTGSFQNVRLGHGVPGTGKSLQIEATATLFHDICTMIGIPFDYHPLGGTVISTYQGGSAERMHAWFRKFNDPKRIVYGAIDDAEQVLQDRTMQQGVSAGVREVISQFLTGTEGAGAVYIQRGSSVIETFTNLTEQIDPAVLSRHQARFPINGARRWEDFLDQDRLWWKHFRDAVPEFTANMTDPTDYEYMSLQAELVSLSQSLEHYDAPKHSTMRDIFDRVLKQHAVTEFKFFAVLAASVQKEFDGFSSREVRNIQSAVSARMVDFDPPDEWMEKPEVFFRRDYEQKRAMLKDLMHQNMGTLKMQDVWVQETSRYLDAFATIAEKQFRREVEAEKKRIRVQLKAHTELKQEKTEL